MSAQVVYLCLACGGAAGEGRICERCVADGVFACPHCKGWHAASPNFCDLTGAPLSYVARVLKFAADQLGISTLELRNRAEASWSAPAPNGSLPALEE